MSNRRFHFEVFAALLLYALILAISLRVLGHWTLPRGVRSAIGLSPMIGGIVVAWAIVRQLNRLDELQRKVQFDAISMAFLGTALATLSYGFLENAGYPRLSMFAVWPFMAALWAVGSLAWAWRYRH